MLSRQQDVLRTRSTLFLSESVGTGKVFQPRVLEERIDGFLSRLQIDRHFIQCENFVTSLIHIRELSWCQIAKSSKVWPSLPSTQLELAQPGELVLLLQHFPHRVAGRTLGVAAFARLHPLPITAIEQRALAEQLGHPVGKGPHLG